MSKHELRKIVPTTRTLQIDSMLDLSSYLSPRFRSASRKGRAVFVVRKTPRCFRELKPTTGLFRYFSEINYSNYPRGRGRERGGGRKRCLSFGVGFWGKSWGGGTGWDILSGLYIYIYIYSSCAVLERLPGNLTWTDGRGRSLSCLVFLLDDGIYSMDSF